MIIKFKCQRGTLLFRVKSDVWGTLTINLKGVKFVIKLDGSLKSHIFLLLSTCQITESWLLEHIAETPVENTKIAYPITQLNTSLNRFFYILTTTTTTEPVLHLIFKIINGSPIFNSFFLCIKCWNPGLGWGWLHECLELWR